MNRFRNVALVVTLGGISLLESVGYASDFGLIHFYGSVLYSGCYVHGTQNGPTMSTTQDQSQSGLNFGMKFKQCRLVDNGQVLAEVSVIHHDWDSLRVLQNNGKYGLIQPKDSGTTLHRFSLQSHLNKANDAKDMAFQFRYESPSLLFLNRDIGLEIIYR